MSKYGWAYISLDTLQSIGSPTGSLQYWVTKTTTSGSQKLLWLTASDTLIVGAPHDYNIGAGPGTYGYAGSSSVTIIGDLHVTGAIRATEYFAQTISSSVTYASGSHKFGDDGNDIHQVTGSMRFGASSALITSGSTVILGNGPADVTTLTGQVTASNGVKFGGAVECDSTLTVDGALITTSTTTLGNAVADVITITGQMTASEGVLVPDNKKLRLGTDADTAINHTGTNFNLQNKVGHIDIDNTATDKNIRFYLGTDTDATKVIVRNNSGANLFMVKGDGTVSGSGVHHQVGNITTEGNLAATGSLTVAAASNLNGNVSLGNAASDVITVSGQITASHEALWNANFVVADDKKLYFGTGKDAHIEYDEDGADILRFSGASAGTAISGSVALNASQYLNFGPLFGTSGYGIRDNSGTIEFKSSGGTWASIADTDNSGSALVHSTTLMVTEGDLRVSGSAIFGNAASDVITLVGQVTASNGVRFDGDVFTTADVTLGNAAPDVTTLTGQVTASNGVMFNGAVKVNSDITLGDAASDVITLTGQVTSSAGMLLNSHVSASFVTASYFKGDGSQLTNVSSTGTSGSALLHSTTRMVTEGTLGVSGSSTFIGSVGVGTASPADYNDSADNLVVYEAGNGGITIATGETDYGTIYFADATAGQDGSHAGTVQYHHGTDKLFFGTAATDQRVTIDSGGKVGIGTTSPADYNDSADNLVVYEAGNGGITIANGVNDWGSLYFADDTSGAGTHAGCVQYHHGTDKLYFGSAGNDNLVTLDSSGRFGIGVTDPDQRLEVSGNIHLSAEVAAPSAPSAGDGGILYVKANGKLYWISDDVSETDLTSAGGGGSASGSAEVHADDFIVSEGVLRCSGSATLGNTAADVVSLTGQVTASAGTFLNGHQIIKRVSKTTNYSVGATDYLIGVSTAGGTVDITIPSAASTAAGRIIVIKDEVGNTPTNRIRVTGSNDSDSIDGEQYLDLESAYASLSLYCDGSTRWFIL